MKRREFIQTSAMTAAAAALFPSFSLEEKKHIGLQLYTLRDVLKTDVRGIIKQVSDFGYEKIEVFGYNDGMLFGMKSKDFSDLVKSMGMKITSGHYGTGRTRPEAKGTLVNDWERAVSDAKEAGQEFMIIAYLQKEERTLDDYKKVCEMMNKAGEMCKKYGVKLGYHNHDFEFVKTDEVIPFDLMLQSLDPTLISIEMDLYWILYAGQDPLQYFAKYPGRFEQWHIKDMDKTDRKRNALVGTGSVDFKSIFAKSSQAGLRNFYIEHDTFPANTTSLESVKQDILNLSKIV